MRRRSGRMSFVLIVAILAILGGGLTAAVRHQPMFYVAAEVEQNGVEIATQSSRLMSRVQDLLNDLPAKSEWTATFDAKELNCFSHEYAAEVNARLGGQLHSPRVSIEGDRVRIGMRCSRGPLSTVLWVELRAWLVKSEANCLAIEIMGIHAGLIPISGQSVLDKVTEAARESNIEVNWYRNEGRPVGIFRFFADQARRPSKLIRAVQIQNGQITIAGRTTIDGAAVPMGVGSTFAPVE